jgi:catalase (peroxidase I)
MWNVDIYTEDGVFLGKADCWLDDVAMVWEIESSEWHMSPEDHDRTVERAARFTAAGAVYTASKPKKIRADPIGVARVLRATYQQAAARPRPPLRAVTETARPPSWHEMA